MEFSRQEFWNGLPCPFPKDLPNPGDESGSLALGGLSNGSSLKESACNAGDTGGDVKILSLGWENRLKEKMATHSSILAWKIP